MGIIELLIIILVIAWLLGFFGRGRFYATGPGVATTGGGTSWIHLLLVVVAILIILRLLGII